MENGELRKIMMIPGEYMLRSEPIQANAGRDTVDIEVANHGDRPIQIGSHFHFFEVNKALRFPRQLAFGKRLNLPAGSAAAGAGPGLWPCRCRVDTTGSEAMSLPIARRIYAQMYGPTVGDR